MEPFERAPLPVVTIGRQFGAGGRTVGEMLARRLKADLFESQIIDEAAQRLNLPKDEVEAEDERPSSRLSRLLVSLGSATGEPTMILPDPHLMLDTWTAMLRATQDAIRDVARRGNVVIVGRGGAYILRDQPGALHVFLRADERIRIRTVMERFETPEDEARRQIKRIDENRTAYIKQVYGQDRNLSSHYDMILDTGRLGYGATVEAILVALNIHR